MVAPLVLSVVLSWRPGKRLHTLQPFAPLSSWYWSFGQNLQGVSPFSLNCPDGHFNATFKTTGMEARKMSLFVPAPSAPPPSSSTFTSMHALSSGDFFSGSRDAAVQLALPASSSPRSRE